MKRCETFIKATDDFIEMLDKSLKRVHIDTSKKEILFGSGCLNGDFNSILRIFYPFSEEFEFLKNVYLYFNINLTPWLNPVFDYPKIIIDNYSQKHDKYLSAILFETNFLGKFSYSNETIKNRIIPYIAESNGLTVSCSSYNTMGIRLYNSNPNYCLGRKIFDYVVKKTFKPTPLSRYYPYDGNPSESNVSNDILIALQTKID